MLDEAVSGNWKTTKKRAAGVPQGSDSPVTVNGYSKDEVISALQKAVRRGMEAEALYWASELMDSGETYRMWRRLVVIAAEDVGLADDRMTATIIAMKQAHDFGRESNIVFQAVMMLCRAPKNREADDASYLYELRRKQGWRILMPPEAVDGHTRRGRAALYQMARQQGVSWEDLWNKEFYYDVALLVNYMPVATNGEPERYRKALMEFLKLPLDTYDIDKCKKPRITSGRSPRTGDALASTAERAGTEIKEVLGGDGEVRPGRLVVKSFTTEDVWYRVEFEMNGNDVVPLGCACPAFERNPQRVCKHMQAVLRAGGKPT